MTVRKSIRLMPLVLISTLIISGCSTFGLKTKQIEVSAKPIEIDIIQPHMPREIDLKDPRWYVVSEAQVANPCQKELDENGDIVKIDGKETNKRPKIDHPEGKLNEKGKVIRVCKFGKENPDWPEDYTYLDKFLDDMKEMNNGDIVFVAFSVSDYELMSYNVQELRRYIRELAEVIVYYREVTMPNGDKGIGVKVEKK